MAADDAWMLECWCGTRRHEPDNDTHLSFNGAWLCCDKCDKWNHGDCAGLSVAQADDVTKYVCKMCSESGEAEHDLDPNIRYKRPAGRGPSGMVWNDKTGEWDESEEDYKKPEKKPEIKKEKKEAEVVPVAKSRKSPAKRKAAASAVEAEDDDDYDDDDDDDAMEVVPVSTKRRSVVPDDSPFGKGEAKPSSFDANYWYKRMKEQMKVTHARPPPAVA